MDGIDFQLKHHRNFLLARSVDRIIQTVPFCVAWDVANDKRRQKAIKLIENLKIRKLQLWVFGDFENHTVRELRKIASAHHVPNYCELSKAELIHHFILKEVACE